MASIRKRTWTNSRGEQTAWVADYFDQAGKRHIKTCSTKKAADTWLVNARGELQRGVHTPENASITVAEAADLWINKSELENLERSTLRQYRNHADLHIKPVIGGEKLARLSTPLVESFRDVLLKKGSRAMARKVLASLKSILGEAQRRGLVAQNAAQPVKVDVKKRDQRKLAVGREIPSKEEIQTILATAEGRWRPFFATAVFTGMRASELRGLTWDAVDFDRGVISVRQRANLWGEIGAPKSAAGERDIPMSPLVVNALREWRLACPRLKVGEGEGESRLWLVFPNGKGKVESHANIVNRGFWPLQVEAGVTRLRKAKDEQGRDIEVSAAKYGLHALRHFFASWAIERAFSPKRVQVLLGHSSIQMTFDVYGHLFPSLEDDHAKFAAGELAVVG
jgi:integrase